VDAAEDEHARARRVADLDGADRAPFPRAA
jgi:hypothetical protein